MTRKNQILKAGLDLFSRDGYAATSTKNIAKVAGVSEGLIFRHFKNKAGLLSALLSLAQVVFEQGYDDILNEKNPQIAIHNTIKLPFSVTENEIELWKLLFKMKWDLGIKTSNKHEQLRTKLLDAFKQLGAPKAEFEVDWLMCQIEGISSSIIFESLPDKIKFRNFLLKKYTF